MVSGVDSETAAKLDGCPSAWKSHWKAEKCGGRTG
jgi:hypothetical protein